MDTGNTTATMRQSRGGGVQSSPELNSAYKWPAYSAHLIHSALIITGTYILHFVQFLLTTLQNLIFPPSNSTTVHFTNQICDSTTTSEPELENTTKMTIEVPALPSLPDRQQQQRQPLEFQRQELLEEFSSGGLPTLRLNSVTMEEEYLGGGDSDSGLASDLHSSSNYNSSDADEDESMEASKKNIKRNLPEQGNYHKTRKDSETSEEGKDENETDATQRLITQVETMFSDEHLAKDGFLLKHVRRRSDGFVSLKLVAGLRKVKQISRDFETVLAALRLSLRLDVNLEGTKVRRMEPLTPYLKSLPISGNKDNKEAGSNNKQRPSAEFTQDELLNRVNMKSNQPKQPQQQKNQRKISNVSTGSSNGGSRHGSFSRQYPSPQQQQPQSVADVFYRNVQALADDAQASRRRGGSLPIPVMGANANNHHHHHNNGYHHQNGGGSPTNYYQRERTSLYLSPSSSPTNSPNEFSARPKSNSYCEGGNKNGGSGGGMSVWLQRRMASASTRTSEGTASSVVLSGILRQPRGPDGTKGFACRLPTQGTLMEEIDSSNLSLSV